VTTSVRRRLCCILPDSLERTLDASLATLTAVSPYVWAHCQSGGWDAHVSTHGLEAIGLMTYRVAALRTFDRQLLQQGRARRPRYLETQPDCWMCPTRGAPKTNEHVFGRWIIKRLPLETLVFEPHRAGPLGIDYSDARGPMPLEQLKVGRVCAPCNGGWMSALEADADRILFGADRALDTSDTQRLAHWAIKTAVVLNVSQPSPLIWTEADRHRVKYGPFPRTAVSVLRVQGTDVNWAQGEQRTWNGERNNPETWSLLSLTTTVRIRLKDIVFVAVRLPWQMSSCSVTLPGQTIWDGEQVHAVSLDALPLAPDWLGGQINIRGSYSSSFWARPAPDFWWTGN